MMELLRNAYMGWIELITQGKLLALFLLVILLFWFYKRDMAHKTLLQYATVSAICCILPVTAAVLMSYQTKFYDYEWIWSIVPVTAVTACGLTVFLIDIWEKGKKGKKGTLAAALGLCIMMVLLAGSMGEKKDDNDSAIMKAVYLQEADVRETDVRRDAYEVLEQLKAVTAGGDVVLWAPVEIMEYAREVDANIRLLYGRNMWDHALNGYSYDVYSEEIYDLYRWMTWAGMSYYVDISALGESVEELPSVETCVQTALEAGVNCILLPGKMEASIVEQAEEMFGVKAQLIEEYWVIYG